MDPNHMKHILVSGFQEFDKGAPQRERMKGFLGTGIFAADGDMWKMASLSYHNDDTAISHECSIVAWRVHFLRNRQLQM